jgi:hypothetical protein
MVNNKMDPSPVKVAIILLELDYDKLSIHHIKESELQETNGVTEKTTIKNPSFKNSIKPRRS